MTTVPPAGSTLRAISTLGLCLGFASTAPCAELRLSRLFDDHMVLQREMPVSIWGQADPGKSVTVTFAGQTKTATAGSDGKWLARLDPMTASREGRLIVHFDTMDGEALVLKGPPAGFVIAGKDREFREARAEIVGKTAVAVWSDDVLVPVAARFAWSSVPLLNLWTESGLPASPFRTDDWPVE